MKKSLKIMLPLLVLGLLGYFGYGMYAKIQEKKEVAERIEHIPDFSFVTLEGRDFTKAELARNSTTVFLYFNSECEYCQEEAKEIGKSLFEFKNSQWVFVSNENPERIKEFAKQYKLLNHDNIYFLHDSRSDFARLFGATTIPYVLAYNKHEELISTFNGFVKVENLLKALP